MTTMFLADHGAEVVWIEPAFGDPFAAQTGCRVWNRGKRGARLDRRTDDKVPRFRALVQESAAAVDGFSIETMDRLGVGHVALSAPNAGTLTLTAYGERGGAVLDASAGQQ